MKLSNSVAQQVKVSNVQVGNFFCLVKVQYFLKGNNADNSNLLLFGLEKQRGIRGRPFDSEGGGGGWHFLEINILTLKMLEINNLSSSGKKINNLTLTC